MLVLLFVQRENLCGQASIMWEEIIVCKTWAYFKKAHTS